MNSVTSVVIGALIGAGATTLAALTSFLTARVNTRTQLDAEQRSWLREARRRTYVDFMDATTKVEHAWWLLGNKLEDHRYGHGVGQLEKRDDLYDSMFQRLQEVQAALGAVQMLSTTPTPTVFSTAAVLAEKLRDMDSKGSTWFKQSEDKPCGGANPRQEFWKAHGECRGLAQAFVKAAGAEFTTIGSTGWWLRKARISTGSQTAGSALSDRV